MGRKLSQGAAASLLLGVTSVTAFAIPEAAIAAQAGITAKPASSGLADIVVTARRREESLQKTPVSVTAVTARDLLERGLRDISDVALITPGFSMQNIQSGTEQPFIRGMATTSFERTLQTSSTLVDGN